MAPDVPIRRSRRAITLVEMLIAMAITLIMMAAVVTVFANVSSSVQARRATIEIASQLRHVRNVLQRDLQGATCPTLPWTRVESSHGYLEIIEGPFSDANPTPLVQDLNGDGDFEDQGEALIDAATSLIPRNNLFEDALVTDGKISDAEIAEHARHEDSLVPGGLGDFDDILALTTRNEEEPFTGVVPFTDLDANNNVSAGSVRLDNRRAQQFANWGNTTIQSPLAEVVWFAVENPPAEENVAGYFGEPGLRTIYRRVLLIAPWVAPYRWTDPNTGATSDTFADSGATIRTQPGVVRVLTPQVDRDEVAQALAALVAFQDRYDLSVRLEWDPRMGDDGRWKIVANTLADLTKRENRYEHHYFRFISNSPDQSDRVFPFGMVSVGNGYGGGDLVRFVADPELFPPANEPRWNTVTRAADNLGATHDLNNFVARFVQRTDLQNPTYSARPFAYVQGDNGTGAPVTARAILNDEGNVVGVVHGPAPHWGAKRGSDVMLTDALAFDIRAYDPGAPLFGVLETPTGSYNPNNPNHVLAAVVEPSDPGWGTAYRQQVSAVNDTIIPNHGTFPLVGQGAYVDLGYGLQFFPPQFEQGYAAQEIWFFNASWTPDRIGQQLAPGYSVFDTWSLHYEHNGVNEDNDLDENDTPMIDEGTDGFDNRDPAVNGNLAEVDHVEDIAHSGVDDVGERETIPPYERPLRGVQIKLRAFERDSQQLREVTVGQHFLPE